MYWRDIGNLCSINEELDALRKPHKKLVKREVFCNKKGVKRNEFYQAQAQGIRPELCIEIKADEYNNESYFEFEGTIYRIIRIYPVKGENLEIICNTLVNSPLAETTVSKNE